MHGGSEMRIDSVLLVPYFRDKHAPELMPGTSARSGKVHHQQMVPVVRVATTACFSGQYLLLNTLGPPCREDSGLTSTRCAPKMRTKRNFTVEFRHQ